jgi:cyanate lyase
MDESTMSRSWAAWRVRRAKTVAGISWTELAEIAGRSLMWTTSALLGQQPVDHETATRIAEKLDLGEDVVEALQLPPIRGTDAVDRSEPVVYRLEEMVQVYGAALCELIREEFGDGIMSAIDFELGFERVADPKGDRVVLTLNGKFLPYRVW